MYLIYNIETKKGQIVREYKDVKVPEDSHMKVIGKGGVLVAESEKGTNTFSDVK